MVLFVKPSDHNPPKTKNEKSEDGVTRFRMKIDFLEKRGNGKCFRHQSTRTRVGKKDDNDNGGPTDIDQTNMSPLVQQADKGALYCFLWNRIVS